MSENANESSEVTNEINDIITAIDTTKLADDCTCVSFAGSGLKLNTKEDANDIVNAINGCDNLITINLEGNTLGIDAAKEIGKALQSKSSLTFALLKDLFTGRLKSEIPDAIMSLSSGIIMSHAKLTVLDLSDNAFGPIGMKSVLPFLQSDSCKSLRTLKLNNNGLGTDGGKLLSKALCDMTSLEVFVCGRNRLENDATIAIGNALSNVTSLKAVEMPQNGIRADGIEAIAKAVKANKGLRILNLNDNNLKGRGGDAIADALRYAKNIEIVNFGDCLLKRKGCISVCTALYDCGNVRNMKELLLDGNEIGGAESVEILERLFSKSDHFDMTLNLSANNFGRDGTEQIQQLLGTKLNLILSEDDGTDEENESDDANEEENDNEENEDNADDDEKADKTADNKYSNEIDEISKAIENEYNDINVLCDKFVEISIEGFDNESSNMKDDALIKSELLLKAAVQKGENEYTPMNNLLVSLGLLKDDDGKYRIVNDLRGPFSALTHSIGCLSPQQKHVLQAFMNRPHKSSENCGKIKHNLMKALFT